MLWVKRFTALAAVPLLAFCHPAVAQVAISQLPAATTLGGTEVAPVVQSATTVKATINQIDAYIAGKTHTWSAAQTFSAAATFSAASTFSTTATFTVAPVFTDQSGSRTALGLGTAATQNTGTSGATVPLLNGANTWSAAQTFSAASTFSAAATFTTSPVVNLNATAAPSPFATGVQLVGADASQSALSSDAFGNFAQWIGRRADGTNASKSAVQNGDSLMAFSATGYGATGYASGARAQMLYSTSQTWTDANQGTQITIRVTPNNSTTMGTNWIFQQDGSFVAGTNGAYIKPQTYTVSTLPSASTAGSGARATVTDATACTFGSTLTGGSSTVCPVYSDGSAWRAG